MALGGWAFGLQALRQWRWDHDREAVLREDALEKRREAEMREECGRKREAYLKSVSLSDLQKPPFFNWKGFRAAKIIRASEKIMADTVARLVKIGRDSPEADRLAILQQCIESFNTLDAKTQFIDTIEREDICEQFEVIVHACGLGHHKDLADEWREW
jgi:hypothetical protein